MKHGIPIELERASCEQAMRAARGFKSPVYLSVGMHSPCNPLHVIPDHPPALFPGHNWDLVSAIESWDFYQVRPSCFAPPCFCCPPQPLSICRGLAWQGHQTADGQKRLIGACSFCALYKFDLQEGIYVYKTARKNLRPHHCSHRKPPLLHAMPDPRWVPL